MNSYPPALRPQAPRLPMLSPTHPNTMPRPSFAPLASRLVPIRAISVISALWMLAACGGSGELSSSGDPPITEESVNGRFVLRILGFDAAKQYAALEEAASPLGHLPDRSIRTQSGERYAPPQGWSLIDMAVHPSGHMTAVLASQGSPPQVRLLRLDERAQVISDTPLQDPAAPYDRYFGDEEADIKDDHAMLPLHTRDAVRLAPLGEDLAVALRSGRHAVVAYRYNHSARGYEQRWRNMVVPGTPLMPRFLVSGSYDTYGQLANQFQVLLATNAEGDVAVAVPASPHNDTFAAHSRHFHFRIPGDPTPPPAVPEHGALFTWVHGLEGRALRNTYVVTQGPTQTYALRASPGGGWTLAGRHRAPDDSTGWNGFAAWLDTSGKLRRQVSLHVDKDDALFDIAELADGRTLVAGATAYRQDPRGKSISDEGAPLLAILGPDGEMAQRVPIPSGSRQNPVYSLARVDGVWWAAGMRDGPGTHSADEEPARLRSDGFVRMIAVP